MTHCRPEETQVITKSDPFSGVSSMDLKPGCYLGARGPALEPGPQGSPCPGTAGLHGWLTIPRHTVQTQCPKCCLKLMCWRQASLPTLAGVQVVPGVGSAQGPAPGSCAERPVKQMDPLGCTFHEYQIVLESFKGENKTKWTILLLQGTGT